MNKIFICTALVKGASPDDEAVIARMPLLRRMKFDAVKNPAVRCQMIAAQRAMDGALGAFLPGYAPPADFVYMADGRPYVRGACISISHTSTLALCAAAAIPVGADVENSGRFIRADMAKRILYSGEEAPRGLLGTWVDKEAYLKLTGKGLAGGMDTFLIKEDAVYAPGGMRLAYIHRPVISGHLVSVCCGEDFEICLV